MTGVHPIFFLFNPIHYCPDNESIFFALLRMTAIYNDENLLVSLRQSRKLTRRFSCFTLIVISNEVRNLNFRCIEKILPNNSKSHFKHLVLIREVWGTFPFQILLPSVRKKIVDFASICSRTDYYVANPNPWLRSCVTHPGLQY